MKMSMAAPILAVAAIYWQAGAADTNTVDVPKRPPEPVSRGVGVPILIAITGGVKQDAK